MLCQKISHSKFFFFLSWDSAALGRFIKLISAFVASFYGQLDRLFAPDFIPTEQDIIRVRVKTSGISETKFLVGDLTYS